MDCLANRAPKVLPRCRLDSRDDTGEAASESFDAQKTLRMLLNTPPLRKLESRDEGGEDVRLCAAERHTVVGPRGRDT